MIEIEGNGKLGFRDLQEFNTAMLARQLWRVLTKLNLIMSKVLRGKYFKRESIWEIRTKATNSWMWISIISARELLEKGARKRVGDGRTTDIWRDGWILDSRKAR